MKCHPLFVILILALGISFSGCPNNDPPERPFVDLSSEIKAFSHFENGSYWIYQNDSVPSFQDSAYAFNSNCGSNYDIDQVGFDYEYCSYELVNAAGVWQMSTFPFLTEQSEGPYLFVLLEAVEGTTQGRAYHFFVDEGGNDTLSMGEEGTYILQRLATLELNGKTYSDAVTIRHTVQTYGNPTEEITLAKGVGIIKRKQWNGDVWSLLRHTAIQ